MITRETLIDFFGKSNDDIYNDNIRKRWITESFKKCGFNPWRDDTCSLKDLDQLNYVLALLRYSFRVSMSVM